MHRDEAVKKLKQLEGQNLHSLAKEYGVTVLSPSGKVNKGWAGHVCERFLGLQINSSRSPNFGSWELKSVPLKVLKNGSLVFKETMAITMIDAYHVSRVPFEESHLLSKLKKSCYCCKGCWCRLWPAYFCPLCNINRFIKRII